MDSELMNFVKDFLWAPFLALVAWAWKWNMDEHRALWKSHDKLKETTAVSYSTLNDRIMSHVDDRVSDTIRFVKEEDAKIMLEMATQRGNIAKLFDKLEEHGQRSESRHHEVLNTLREMTNSFHQALNTKADK